MKNMNNDLKLNNFIKMLIIFLFVAFLLSFLFEKWHNNLPVDCRTAFRNESFMNTMHTYDGGDDYIPLQCKDLTDDEFGKCFYNNATKYQRDFSNTCRWLGPEYFIGGGLFVLRYGLPIMCIVLVILTFIFPKFIIKHFLQE